MPSFLIIQTAFFGDVILATALIEQVAVEYPEANIDVLVQKSREVLLENNPHLRQVYALDKKSKMKSSWSLIREFRKNDYDYVLNVHRHGSSGWITWLCGAKESVGFNVHPLSFLFDRTVEHHKEGMHEIERNYLLGRHLFTQKICLPKLYPSREDFERVKHDRPYVTMSPASVWETKKWPEEKWIALTNQIPKDVDVFLLGGPSDVDLCERIADSCDRSVLIKAGDYSFLASAALMSRAIMNYTNDSAPVHMASAMNAPVTTLFLSTVPAFGYGPLSHESMVFEHATPLKCKPCGIHGWKSCPKGHFKCSKIDPQLVYNSSLAHKI